MEKLFLCMMLFANEVWTALKKSLCKLSMFESCFHSALSTTNYVGGKQLLSVFIFL